jgi:hypothetical protein
VNVLAALGLVVLLYSLLMLAARLALRALPRWRSWAPAVAALGATILGIGYLDILDDDKAAYDQAYAAEREVLGVVRAHIPNPPDHSTIYTFGHPAYWRPGVPVFAATWDLNGALKLQWHDPTLNGYPAVPGTTFVCGRNGLHPAGNGYGPSAGSPYGLAFFVDVAGNRAMRIDSPRACRSAVEEFRPGPLLQAAG